MKRPDRASTAKGRDRAGRGGRPGASLRPDAWWRASSIAIVSIAVVVAGAALAEAQSTGDGSSLLRGSSTAKGRTSARPGTTAAPAAAPVPVQWIGPNPAASLDSPNALDEPVPPALGADALGDPVAGPTPSRPPARTNGARGSTAAGATGAAVGSAGTATTGTTPLVTGSTGPVTPRTPLRATQPVPRDSRLDPYAEDSVDEGYQPLGLRTGGFTWYPAVEASAGYASNIPGRAGGEAGALLRVAPEITGQSDWSRHALSFDLRGSYTNYPQYTVYDQPSFQGTVRGRVDLSDEMRMDLRGGYALGREQASSANNPANTLVPATVQTLTGSVGLTRDVGLFALTLRGDVARGTYSGGELVGGGSLGVINRDNTQVIGALRVTYNASEALKPFVEGQLTSRTYDQAVINGDDRNSTGYILKGGVTTDLGPLLRGEISAGYGVERPRSASLSELRGLVVDGSLVWSPTRLTKVTLTASTAFEPSTVSGVSGSVADTVGVTLEQSLRRDLTAQIGGQFLTRTYTATSMPNEYDLKATTGLTYKFNRNVQVFVRGEFERFMRVGGSGDYDSETVYAGVRLQR